ncbi:eCIS core domain-containing protein [Psychroserpens luteolus]|uniref:eCIS core domain-containing protein n=1 Tax=Psychroserpens luteolus TaxID=2855840 RepID=UPI001E2B327D|nr:DUF4157 domain-containing protein [Psychroserpens luteolus]MCD2257706.1 DUF4157 domain-containing protein [Psychroserpens luteolus]
MKNIFSSRRNRNKRPHNNEEAEKSETPFFSKESKTPFFNKGATVQTKLTIGQPNDKYEKEADTMADAVVNNSSKPEIQNKEISNIQRESLTTPQEDEKLGTAEQRIEEDKLIQEKPEVQRLEEPEEDMVNKLDEEEGEVQTKSNTGATQTANANLSQQIKNKSGKGKSLPKKTQTEMESSFRTNFSDVNIHTDDDAIHMNKELGAQAFTHGKDVYFNSGKYNPDSSEGKHLLAHELTHVVQQNGKEKARDETKNSIQPKPHAPDLEDKTNYAFDTYRITKHDLSDPEIKGRIEALNWNGLIHYRDNVSDPDVKLYMQNIIDSYTSHEVALGYKIQNPPFTKMINGLKVVVLADQSDTTIGQDGVTKYSFPDKINWVTHPKTKEVTSIDFDYIMTIQSNYKQIRDREGASGYGYGTRAQDKNNNTTSLAHHEGQHVLDILSYLEANPLPTFNGRLRMSKTSIEKEGKTYINALSNYKSQMDAFLVKKGHCVGISIDKFNKSKGVTTHKCKSTKP